MAVPFLFELRTLMDWMWTKTSMTLGEWIKMEDIFAHIFQLKVKIFTSNPALSGKSEVIVGLVT
jgi:Piezo non-specific cation channel, R-Ras-binding domain